MNSSLKHELLMTVVYLVIGVLLLGIPIGLILLLGKYAGIVFIALVGMVLCIGTGYMFYESVIRPRVEIEKFFERPEHIEKTALQKVYGEMQKMTYEEQKELLDRLTDNYKKGKKT